jgi:hypothetical protein
MGSTRYEGPSRANSSRVQLSFKRHQWYYLSAPRMVCPSREEKRQRHYATTCAGENAQTQSTSYRRLDHLKLLDRPRSSPTSEEFDFRSQSAPSPSSDLRPTARPSSYSLSLPTRSLHEELSAEQEGSHGPHHTMKRILALHS